jgi:hypothetical protein
MSLYTTLAQDLRRVRLDLTKCSQATHRKDGAYFSCLQNIDEIAKVLEGNFTVVAQPEPAPKKGKVQRVIRDGNVIEGPWGRAR